MGLTVSFLPPVSDAIFHIQTYNAPVLRLPSLEPHHCHIQEQAAGLPRYLL